jgi:hypothetical protein
MNLDLKNKLKEMIYIEERVWRLEENLFMKTLKYLSNMTENEYIDWIQGKHRLAPLDLIEKRYSHMIAFDTDLKFVKELLKNRRETAKKY